MEKSYNRTNIYLIDESLWKWAKFRANTLCKTSVSEYLFELINIDKRSPVSLELEVMLKKMIDDIEAIDQPRLDEHDIDVYDSKYNEIAIKGLQEIMDKIQKVGESKEDEQK